MMWSRFDGTDSEWDNLLRSLESASPFALSHWSRFKSFGRWSTLRATLGTDDRPVSAVQIMWFTFFGVVTIAWIPGGTAGSADLDARDLLHFIKKNVKSRLIYCRISHHIPTDSQMRDSLLRRGWSQPRVFVGAKETFILKRANGKLADQSRLSSNWGRNLQRGLKRDNHTTIWTNPDIDELHKLHNEMTTYKGAKGPSTVPSAESLSQLVDSMSDAIIFTATRDHSGHLVAVRAAFIYGDKAWDAIAASNESARKNYSSYACAWRLIEELDLRGIQQFDLAGIDDTKNEGVFNFKKGLGGERTAYLGEWDVASTQIFRHVAGALISRLV